MTGVSESLCQNNSEQTTHNTGSTAKLHFQNLHNFMDFLMRLFQNVHGKFFIGFFPEKFLKGGYLVDTRNIFQSLMF